MNDAISDLAAELWAMAACGPEEGFGGRLDRIEARLREVFAAQSETRKPLTVTRIHEITSGSEVFEYYEGAIVSFVREIERAHGIGTEAEGAQA